MQWIMGHGSELHLVVIYTQYWNAVDSLYQNDESTSELDSEGANTPMGPNGAHSELIYHDDTVYEGWIGSRFIIVHKDIVIII